MELYLDSANIEEIKAEMGKGYYDGVTTTPTFFYKHGYRDIDKVITQLYETVCIAENKTLQVEALGETVDDICREVKRINCMLYHNSRTTDPKDTIVFKIPMNEVGAIACKKLSDDGYRVNLHLVYNLQQAYLAMKAGAEYICVLVGRSQDHGIDAESLIVKTVKMIEQNKSDAKVMFSSVRTNDHVEKAILLGAQCCTIPSKIMKSMLKSELTKVGTEQFVAHTNAINHKFINLALSTNQTEELNPEQIVNPDDNIIDFIDKYEAFDTMYAVVDGITYKLTRQMLEDHSINLKFF